MTKKSILTLLVLLFCTEYSYGQKEIEGYLEGRVTINSAIDSTGDYSDIELIIVNREGGENDTLAYAVTDFDGKFSTNVTAPSRGVYPLLFLRNGNVISVSEYVVAQGDSVSLRAELPLGSTTPKIRSNENSAWLAYKNTEASHQNMLRELVAEGKTGGEDMRRAIGLTSNLLWGMRTIFPSTAGAEVAAAKSIVMIEGWNDSLVVAHSKILSPANSGFVQVARTARRSMARLEGQENAISLLRSFKSIAKDSLDKATLQAELIQARLDSFDTKGVLEEVDLLRKENEDVRWMMVAEWAEYEAKYLMPGMIFPSFNTVDISGDTLRTENYFGKAVVVDFWSPEQGVKAQQIDEIKRLVDIYPFSLEWISIALTPSPELLGAVLEDRNVPGKHVWVDEASQEAFIRRYNLKNLPTRFLIGNDGKIVKKFLGTLLVGLDLELQKYHIDNPPPKIETEE